jgi:hypothetical protein
VHNVDLPPKVSPDQNNSTDYYHLDNKYSPNNHIVFFDEPYEDVTGTFDLYIIEKCCVGTNRETVKLLKTISYNMENLKNKRKQSRKGNANRLFKQRIEGDHKRSDGTAADWTKTVNIEVIEE